ncbi:MAG: PASTA domain-containing protein [Brevinematia bacterium]
MRKSVFDVVLYFIRSIFDKIIKFFLSIFGISSETDLFSHELRKSLFLLFVSVVVFFVFFVFVMAIFLVPSPVVKVPNVIGYDILDAIAKLEDSKLIPSLELVISQDKPRGEVLRQIPSAGNIVREGKTVKLFVSIGSGEFSLPDFSGKTLEEVRSFLSTKGVYSSVEYTRSEYDSGLVVKTMPSPGAKVKPGMQVTIFVSTGIQDNIPMPNLIGFNYEDAAIFLNSRNIKFKMTPVQVSDPANDGIVLDHIPREGEFLSKDSSAEVMIGVFGDEVAVQNVRFVLYQKNLSSLSREGVSTYYVDLEIEDQMGVRRIKKTFNNLSAVIVPLKVRGVAKVKIYVNGDLVGEDTI